MSATIGATLPCCNRSVRLKAEGQKQKRYCGKCGCDWFFDVVEGMVLKVRRLDTYNRDPQRQRVYCFENDFLHFPSAQRKLTLEEATKIVRRAWDRYVPVGPPPPAVTFSKRSNLSTGCATTITLAMLARNPAVVLHEVAHAILDYWDRALSNRPERHGPRFVRLLGELLEWYGVVGADEFCEAAGKYNVRAATRGQLGLSSLRKEAAIV